MRGTAIWVWGPYLLGVCLGCLSGCWILAEALRRRLRLGVKPAAFDLEVADGFFGVAAFELG